MSATGASLILVLAVASIVGLGFAHVVAGRDQMMRKLLTVGLFAKFVGSWANFQFTKLAFGDLRDVESYHSAAVQFSRNVSATDPWPSGYVGSIQGPTGNVAGILGWVYWLIGPDVRAGYVIFALLSYIGAVLIVRAAIKLLPDLDGTLYTTLVVLSPTMVFHPSIVGKDAWVVFALGLVVTGLAHWITEGRAVSGVVLLVLGLLMVNLVRPHIAAATMLALGATLLGASESRLPRVIKVVVAAGLLVLTVSYLGVLLDSKGADGVFDLLDSTSANTRSGGSNFETRSLATPIGLVIGIITVLFRPFLHETNGLAQMATAFEGLILTLAFAIYRRRVAFGLRQIRRLSFLRFCFAFSVSVVPLLATISNFGTLARQRAQIWPFLLILLCMKRDNSISASEPVAANDQVEDQLVRR